MSLLPLRHDRLLPPRTLLPRSPFRIALVVLFGLLASACGESIGGVDGLSQDALLSIPSGGGVPEGTGAATSIPNVEPDPSNPQHFFIGPAGSDDADGKTPETAWQHLSKALAEQKAGDVFWLMDGVYDEELRGEAHYVLEVPGTADAWIRYRAMPGHRPVIEASTTSAFEITQSFIEIQGLEIRGTGFTTENSYGYGIVVARAHHVRVIDNEIHGFPTGGFGTRGSSHLYLFNNVVHDNALWDANQGSGISFWRLEDRGFVDDAAGYSNYIVGNILYRNENRVFCGFCGEDILTDGNAIIVDQNTMDEEGNEAIYPGRTLIANNIAFDNGGRAINVFQSHRVDVFNNTAYQNLFTPNLDGNNGEISTFATEDVRIANNLIVPRPGRTGITTNGKNQARQSNVIVVGRTGKEGNDFLVTTAGFVNASLDAAVADFRLRVSSPAIDVGIRLLPTDADNRPRGDQPDVGAYEAGTGEDPLEASPSGTVVDKQQPDE